MGHRHLFTSSPMFDNHDQNWNHMHVEQPYLHLSGPSVFEAGSVIMPMENASMLGGNSALHWSSAPRATEYSSSAVRMDLPEYPVTTTGPIYNPLVRPSVGYSSAPQSYADRPSSSSYRAHIPGVEGGGDNSAMAMGRGPCKRKSPVSSVICDRGSTSSYFDAGSSSGFSLSSDFRLEKLHIGAQNRPWDPIGMTPNYRESNISISEASQRNVRSRSTLDLEMNLARTHLSNNSYCYLRSVGHPVPRSGTLDLAGLNAGAITHDWNRPTISPAVRGRFLTSDTHGSNQGTDQFLVGSSSANNSVEFNIYHRDLNSSRNSIVPPQNFHGSVAHSARGGRSGHSQRATPGYRAITNYPRVGYIAPENAMQSMHEPYPSRHSSVGWRSNERNGRSRISYDRLRPFSDEAVSRDRVVSEGVMIMDRSSLYGSRNFLDQHRDMRLDVDNMSYEELLALGERIGSVNTGLSEDVISKCLTETTYCSYQNEEEESCVICLEEYKDKDDVGTLRNCSHDYHVGCIRKWLSMKNACPICKSPALADKMKDK